MSDYATSGVDEEREQAAFASVMRPHLASTSVQRPGVGVRAGIGSGHFASVLDLGGASSVAITTDGVGTKILLARQARRYDTVGIDCVANNVNDLVCLGADPIAMVDYLAIDEPDERVLGELARGMAEGARQAGVAIVGGEIAQLGAMLAPRGSGDESEPMFDLVGTAIGVVPPARELMDGSAVTAGDVVVGLASSGLHSNGYSLARRSLAGVGLDDTLSDGTTVVDALLAPTRVYVAAVRALWQAGIEVHGIVHISGGGLLNLTRLAAPGVSYRLDALPEPAEIFALVAERGGIAAGEMHATFNMGTGMAVVVPEHAADAVVTAVAAAGEVAAVVGRVVAGDGSVDIPDRRLSGRGDVFTSN